MNIDKPGICYSYPENTLYEDINGTAIENPQRSRICKANHYLKIHNVPLKLASFNV